VASLSHRAVAWPVRLVMLFGVAGLSTACHSGSKLPEPSVTPLPALPLGLIRTNEWHIPDDPQGTSHSTEIVVDDDSGLIYIADSFGGVLGYKIDGKEDVVFHAHGDSGQLHCNSIALHRASHSLYCVALDQMGVSIVDVPAGRIRELPRGPSKLIGYHNIVVVGDTLYAANALTGLDAFPIMTTGELGPLTHGLDKLAIERLATDGTTLFAAGSDIGLLQINRDLTTVTIAPLDGPVIRMRVHDGQAAIALGSQGALLIDVRTGETVAAQHPKCVVTSADFKPEVFAYGCYTGMYAYDLLQKRVFGWERMRFGALDTVFVKERLITTDWWYVYFYDLRRDGSVYDLDYPPGYVVQPGSSLSFVVRNPGDIPLHLRGAEVAPAAELSMTVPASSEPLTRLSITTDERVRSPAETIIVRQGAYPALGTTFPVKGLEGSYIYFSGMTCALQFPAMRDMGWLSAHGAFPRGLTPRVINAEGIHVGKDMEDVWMQSLAPLWAPVKFFSLEELYPADLGLNTYNALFNTDRFISGGDNDNEYFIDSNGIVVDYSRVYWGAFSPRQ
jgi:hypothetical protein